MGCITDTSYMVIKFVFHIFNLIFLLLGLVILAVGAYLQVTRGSYFGLLQTTDYVNANSLLIAAGIIVICVALFGFAGAMMENQCLLVLYFFCVILIFGLEIAAGAVGFMYSRDIESKIGRDMQEGMSEKYRWSSWDKLQSDLICCGVYNYTDWNGIKDEVNQLAVPDSCCGFPNCGLRGSSYAYDTGCYIKLKTFFEDNMYWVGAAGIAVGALQLLILGLTIAFLCCMSSKPKIYKM